MGQRSVQEVEKLARLLVKYKHILSNGELDFKANPNVKHSTTAEITTTTQNPKIVARGQRCSPEEKIESMGTRKEKRAKVVEKRKGGRKPILDCVRMRVSCANRTSYAHRQIRLASVWHM